ncbi:ankyrin repeat-containing protein [Gossypium australe]|uniref:Ankyrin repeat-containing protein n=1 Tax=Gossypium australe TaxID=47621 RepID=A0A5B6VAJ0_9ROSI|nr:ankyrin repeat-containing protein [Gossypium australe]
MESKSLRFLTQQSFFAAVQSGELQSVKQMLDKLTKDEPSDGSSTVSDLVASQNESGKTALYIAAENNLQEIFSYLLKFCDVEVVKMRSNSDINTFHVAAKLGNLGMLCELCDSTNTSPLYFAAVKGHLDVANAILSADPSCVRIVRKNGKTALHTAATYGLINVVKALTDCDQGIVSIKDTKGQTALHMAVKGQCPAVVDEILLANHSLLNERDNKGNTALHIATRKARPQIVSLLLTKRSIDINAINNQHETSLDFSDKLQYGESTLEIKGVLMEAGAQHARYVGQVNEAMELKRTVSDIKHEVQSQFLQNQKTNVRVSGIAKELQKLHREAVQNTTNSITVVAVLFASIAFLAIFNLPGEYVTSEPDEGKANIADHVGFRIFCPLNATSLFISLAVVVVQITLVAWDTNAQKQVVSVVNKLMWAACACTCGAFLKREFMDGSLTIVGAPILVGTLESMCYFVFRQHFRGFHSDSQRRIKRASGSKSFSWTYSANISDDDDYNSDLEKIYAL